MNNDRFKYRVWHKEEKRYVTGNFSISPFGHLHKIYGDEDGVYEIELDTQVFAVEQCTGLKDKNGTLIYEGDVVLFVGKVNLAVQYTPNEWEMAGDDVNVPLTENTARFVKIVGNIHEVTE